MRAAFFSELHRLMESDSRLVLLLGNVGMHAAREIARAYPDRYYDLGLREQAIISIAAGLAKGGMAPVVYGIAPFFVERAYEQIKLDIGYNACRVVLVTTGAGDAYEFEGYTHQCPYDREILRHIMNLRIVTPKTPAEVGIRLVEAINHQKATYIRL